MYDPQNGYLKGLATEKYVDDAVGNIDLHSLNYLPLTGGQLTGALTIQKGTQVALDIVGENNQSQIKFWSSGAVALQNYTSFKDNELVTKKYVDDSISAIPAPAPGGGGGSSSRLLEFAQDTPVGRLNPGQFTVMNGNTYVNQWSKIDAIVFPATDANGDRYVKGTSQPSIIESFLGSALTILDEAGEQTFLRVVPTGTAGGSVMLQYLRDEDMWYILWPSSLAARVMVNGDPYISHGNKYKFHLPDLFF